MLAARRKSPSVPHHRHQCFESVQHQPYQEYRLDSPIPKDENLWNYGTVEPGEEHAITILVDVSDAAVDGDIITNEVCVWASELGDKFNKDNFKLQISD